MKKLLMSMLLLLAAAPYVTAQTPAKDVPITVSDGAGGTAELRFGLAPDATDGIDAALGEAELPPLPPSGVFDARFIGADININLGQGLAKDYRTGDANFNGMKTHEISYQPGTGTSITISWDLPGGVTGSLEDLFGGVIVKKAMTGKDNFVVPNPAITKLKMTVTYTPVASAVEQKNAGQPADYQLHQNHPNPFNPTTNIRFSTPKSGAVRLEIFNSAGKLVRTLVAGNLPAGTHTVSWDAMDDAGARVASGVYLYTLKAGEVTLQRKLVLMK